MSRKRPPPSRPAPPAATPPSRPDHAPDVADDGESRLQELARERLAAAIHAELFLALQDRLPPGDPRWVLLFSHGFDDVGTVSPLLSAIPLSLRPVRFQLAQEQGDAHWYASRVIDLFGLFPARVREWEVRLSFQVVTALGEPRCAALGRAGMAEVIGAVEDALIPRRALLPTADAPGPLPLDAAALHAHVERELPRALARVRLAEDLSRAFPHVDDEELDELVATSVANLEVAMGAGPELAITVRAGERPWLPLASVTDALRRRLSGGLRILR